MPCKLLNVVQEDCALELLLRPLDRGLCQAIDLHTEQCLYPAADGM